MKLTHPCLSRSDDRSQTAAYNPTCGDPYKWFDTEYFRNESLSCISFNFLVDWRDRALQNAAWMKRVITAGYSTDPREIADAIYRCDGQDFVNAALTFCEKNGFLLQYVLIPNISCDDWSDQNNKLILCDVTRNGGRIGIGRVQAYASMEFVGLIRGYKKDYHPIGKEKAKWGSAYRLQYSETDLEVFLSEPHEELAYEGDTGFPGDADVVLFDNVGAAKALIELKKHDVGSAQTARTIADESMSLYRADSLKYDSLNVLASALHCPLHVLFFPVTDDPKIKVESFIPSPDKVALYRAAEKLYELPNCHERPSLARFSAAFIAQNAQCCERLGADVPADTKDLVCTAPSYTPYVCPHCGAPVRLDKNGRYLCFDRCGMLLMRFYKKELSAQQCEALLRGQKVPFVNAYGEPITLLPKAVPNGQPFKGRQYYRWDYRYRS